MTRMILGVMRWVLVGVVLGVVGGGAEPVAVHDVRGRVDGPVVRTVVWEVAGEKVLGLDRQLAAMRLQRGWHRVEAHDPAGAGGGRLPAGTGVGLEIIFKWERGVEEERGGDTNAAGPARPVQMPRVAATEPRGVEESMKRAMAGSLPERQVARLRVEALSRPGRGEPERIEVTFAPERTGTVPKSRQNRIARRLVAEELTRLTMLARQEGYWPENFPPEHTLALYDAEGTGGSGPQNLERVVKGTGLEAWILRVSPEDIREGGLTGCAGVIFPGGGGRGIARGLQVEGVELVKDYVAGGGAYVGVCAGAFFVTAGNASYSAMVPLRHQEPWFKGRHRLKMDLTPEGVAIFGEEFAMFETIYNNGPVFLEEASELAAAGVTVLATFANPVVRPTVRHDEMVGTPAIFAAQWGQGRILSISPHPEGHEELYPLVARGLGWVLGRERE